MGKPSALAAPAPTVSPTPQPPEPHQAETRIVLRGISWPTFVRLVESLGDQHVLLAYDRGVLELMSPSPRHEREKKLMGRMVEAITEELDIPCEASGSPLWKREEEERGLAPDECYFLNPAKVAAIRGRPPDRPGDPYPDLAIEVEVSRSALDKLAIYASLGVPEVWRLRGDAIQIHRLRPDGAYESVAESQFLPIRPEEVVLWLARAEALDGTTWARQLRAWIRDEVAPRRRG